MAKIIYKDVEVNLTEGVSADTALGALKSIYPELANATLNRNANGDFEAVVATATKGAGNAVVYNGARIQLAEGVTIESAKDALMSIYPELQNSTVAVNAEGDFVLTVATATKGM